MKKEEREISAGRKEDDARGGGTKIVEDEKSPSCSHSLAPGASKSPLFV